jgi:hypothetical protein
VHQSGRPGVHGQHDAAVAAAAVVVVVAASKAVAVVERPPDIAGKAVTAARVALAQRRASAASTADYSLLAVVN